MASSTNNENIEKERSTPMYEGKNIHSSPVDGKLLCSFSEKTCMQRRLNRYAFCIRHVLEDKNSPFKQCKFVAKYNGQRCTNAIPLREDRIYCNSHLQVLGLVPKKSRKKKATEPRANTTKHITKPSSTELALPNHRSSQNLYISKQSERAAGFVEASNTLPELRVPQRAKLLSSNHLLPKFVITYSQTKSQKQNLLSFYDLCSSDEDESDEGDHGLQAKRKQLRAGKGKIVVESATNLQQVDAKGKSRSAKLQQLRESLHAELLSSNKEISSHHQDVKKSSQVLQLLVNAAQSSPALTTAAINENGLLGSRKRCAPASKDFIPCTAETPEKIKCERRSIPYTKYCYLHILNDSKQQLFRECAADVLPASKCSQTALDLHRDEPLCPAHMIRKDIGVQPVRQPMQPIVRPVQLAAQKLIAKKARRKPQVKATPAQKPAKSNRRVAKKESNRISKSDRSKKGVPQPAFVKVRRERAVNNIDYGKPCLFSTESIESEQHQHSLIYRPLNGTLKLDQLASAKNDMFGNDSFKEQEMFGDHEMDVDDSLENDDLSEDLGDISPTGLLRETVLKLPPESPDPTVSSQPRASPVEAFSMNSMNQGNFHKPIVTSNRMEHPRRDDMCTSDMSPRISHSNVSESRPSRTTVITVPKYPSNVASHSTPLGRQMPAGINTDYTAFRPIGPAVVKSEVVARKSDPRTVDVNHGLQFFPLPFDPVLNSSVAWGGGGKLLLNNRARPLLLTSQMNPVTFSPPSLSPHISPQITLGTAFNFDRPTVLQHSNSPSPTLSPFSAHLPNSPHSKLVPRTLRLESRGNSNDIHDPFFGASFDKP